MKLLLWKSVKYTMSIETFIFLGTVLFLVGTEFMSIEIKNGK